MIASTTKVKATKAPLKNQALKELVIETISEVMGGGNTKAIESRENRPRLMNYKGFAKDLPRRFEHERVFAALDTLNKNEIEFSYRFQKSEFAAVFVPDPKKNRRYVCSFKSSGEYDCCTDRLSACGGLRGKPCKHLIMALLAVAKKAPKIVGDLDELLDNYKKISKKKPTGNRDESKQLLLSSDKKKGWKRFTTKPSEWPKNKKSVKSTSWHY